MWFRPGLHADGAVMAGNNSYCVVQLIFRMIWQVLASLVLFCILLFVVLVVVAIVVLVCLTVMIKTNKIPKDLLATFFVERKKKKQRKRKPTPFRKSCWIDHRLKTPKVCFNDKNKVVGVVFRRCWSWLAECERCHYWGPTLGNNSQSIVKQIMARNNRCFFFVFFLFLHEWHGDLFVF